MFDKLDSIEKQYDELLTSLGSTAVQSDPAEYKKQAKQLAEIEETVERYREYKSVVNDIAGAQELASGADADMRELAQQELKSLSERRDALVAALADHLPGATWTVPEGGYFLWAELPEDAERLLARAREQGVAFEPGAGFAAFGGCERAARLAFSWEAPDALREGVRRLGALV